MGVWTRNLEHQSKDSRAKVGSREPEMCASMRRAMARAAYMGELVVGVLGRLVIVLGSALGLQTWRKCCGAHPSVILPSVPTPIWTMCELLLVQAYQGSNSVLHVRPCGEEKASS